MNNTQGQKDIGRNYHWHPNDHLHFHTEKYAQRCPVKNSFNEPYYQYRETKLEHVPKPRNTATYRSTVFSTGAYVQNKAPAPVNRPPPSATSSRSQIDVAPKFETSYQRQFYNAQVPVHQSPRKRAPVCQTKIGKDY